jgi:hypothetical protein
MLENIAIACFVISIIQYYMYMTNVVWEYLNLLSKIIKIPKFFEGTMLISAAKLEPNYLMFINSVYNNFFTKLISCPICTGFWMSIIASLLLGNILLFGLIAYVSLCLYFSIKLLTNRSYRI